MCVQTTVWWFQTAVDYSATGDSVLQVLLETSAGPSLKNWDIILQPKGIGAGIPPGKFKVETSAGPTAYIQEVFTEGKSV